MSRRALTIALASLAGLAVALLIVTELVLPGIAENRIEDRLTEGGGSAEAEVSAFPAARLLLDEGRRVTVRGADLALDIPDATDEAFGRLNGFDEVDIDLRDFRAGPLEVDRFELAREGEGPYSMRMDAVATPESIASFGGSIVGGPLAARLGRAFFGAALPDPIPVELDLEVEADGGRVTVVSGEAEVAGFDASAIAELITTAIAVRI